MTFDHIYHTHKKLVYNLALQYVQNTEDAEEITQDVFVSIHHGLDSFNAQSKLSTWIYRITINRSLDFVKAKQRQKRFGFLTSLFYNDSNDVKHDTPHFDHPGIQLEHKESLAALFKHINQLPDNQRTALILSKIEQQSQADIAEVMNLSAKAVESLVQRAKINLSKKLNSNEGK
ncbi:MAG: RNA polymerase sigma factor [Bacteroidota bacterium]